ncbi:MAG: hypothetical protein OHK0039_44060 [Bacteroidia bacterium]
MDLPLTFLALFQLLLSIVIGVVFLYFTYKGVHRIVSGRYPIGTNNTAFAIFSGSIMFSVGYLVSSVIQPLLNTFRTLLASSAHSGELILRFGGYLLLFLSISTVIAVLVNLLGTFLFTRLTREVNELQAIAQNDLSVGIITAVIILVITLFAKDGVVFLLESIVPYPEIRGVY